MTITVQLEQYDLPLFWAPALINHDLTGYTTEELAVLEDFIDDMIETHGRCWAIDVGGDVWFTHWHDAQRYGVRGCDVATFVFDVKGE